MSIRMIGWHYDAEIKISGKKKNNKQPTIKITGENVMGPFMALSELAARAGIDASDIGQPSFHRLDASGKGMEEVERDDVPDPDVSTEYEASVFQQQLYENCGPPVPSRPPRFQARGPKIHVRQGYNKFPITMAQPDGIPEPVFMETTSKLHGKGAKHTKGKVPVVVPAKVIGVPTFRGGGKPVVVRPPFLEQQSESGASSSAAGSAEPVPPAKPIPLPKIVYPPIKKERPDIPEPPKVVPPPLKRAKVEEKEVAEAQNQGNMKWEWDEEEEDDGEPPETVQSPVKKEEVEDAQDQGDDGEDADLLQDIREVVQDMSAHAPTYDAKEEEDEGEQESPLTVHAKGKVYQNLTIGLFSVAGELKDKWFKTHWYKNWRGIEYVQEWADQALQHINDTQQIQLGQIHRIIPLFEHGDPEVTTDPTKMWYCKHCGTLPQNIRQFMRKDHREWRISEYENFISWLESDQTFLCELVACRQGRHRSVAWAWVKHQIAYATKGLALHDTVHVCTCTYNQTRCFRQGKPCDECTPNNPELDDIACWFVNEYNRYYDATRGKKR